MRGWPKGYVSLTYDDGLSSQLDIAVPQLERAGFRGTFFLTWNNMQDRAQDWAALARRGHELANHTISHPCDLQREGVEQFKDKEIDPMQHWLARIEGPKRSRDFAYPCDVTNIGPGNPNQQADRYANLLRSAGVVRARTSKDRPIPCSGRKTLPIDSRRSRSDMMPKADRRLKIILTTPLGIPVGPFLFSMKSAVESRAMEAFRQENMRAFFR